MDREYRIVCPDGHQTGNVYTDLGPLALVYPAATHGHDHDPDDHRIEFREVTTWHTLTKESVTP